MPKILTLGSLGRTYTLHVPEHNLLAFQKPEATPLADPYSSITQVLAKPIGALPLQERRAAPGRHGGCRRLGALGCNAPAGRADCTRSSEPAGIPMNR